MGVAALGRCNRRASRGAPAEPSRFAIALLKLLVFTFSWIYLMGT